MECPTPTVAAVLDGIERQLTEAAELVLTGGLSEALHAAAQLGALSLLPKPLAPGHIQVLQRLKRWKELELIPPQLHEQLQRDILAQSRSSAEAGESSTAAGEQRAATTTVASAPQPSTSHAKRQKLNPDQQTLFQMLPNATRTRIPAPELKRQRDAAARDEDYEVEWQDMRRFRKEIKGEEAPPVVKVYPCDKCGRKFDNVLGLQNHSMWHAQNVRPKAFSPAQAKVPVNPPALDLVGLRFTINDEGVCSGVNFMFGGLSLADVVAEQHQAEQLQREREAGRVAEAERRRQLREAEDAADNGEHRSGSAHRRSYTSKQKLKYLEVLDAINADASQPNKIAAYEADLRAKGCPYTTCLGWAKPTERARISAGAGKEHAATLLRIDKKSRQCGKFAKRSRGSPPEPSVAYTLTDPWDLLKVSARG